MSALCSPTRAALISGRNAGQTRIPEGTAPDLKNKSFKLAADVEIPTTGADGVIATQGGRFNGWGFYLLGGTPVFHYNLADVARYTIAGKQKLAPGKHVVLVDFNYDGGVGKGATVTITVDEKPVAEGRVERTIPFRVSADEKLDIGEDTGTPVSEDYKVPFKFTGTVNRVLIRLGEGQLTEEDQEQINRAKAAFAVAR